MSEKGNDRPPAEEKTTVAVEAASAEGSEGLTSAESPAAVERASADEIARLNDELERTRDLLLRKHAEFENFRRRTERERQEFIAHAAASVVKELLPVLDNLERALEAARTGSPERFREGVEIIYRQFRDVLVRHGLKEIEAEGKPFDPHVHEAVGRVETDEHEEGRVLEVLQKGYFLKDRMLRPALVSVSQRAGGDSESEEETTGGDDTGADTAES